MLIKTEYFGQGGSASTADWHILRERQSIDIVGELEVSLGLTDALHRGGVYARDRTDESGCEDMLDMEWEDIFEEADSEPPSEDDSTDEEGRDMLYGNQKKSTGWEELQRNMQTSARKVSESKGYIGNTERIRFRKNAAFRDATE
ncbi:hypothetical protein BGZ91_001150, partial [Linnemannia elongata]